MAFEDAGHGLAETLPSSSPWRFLRRRRGPRRETQGQGAVGPPPPWRRFPDWPATPARLRSSRRRNPLTEPMLTPVGPSQDGRRFVPPGKRPSTGVAARKGRERPRPRAVHAAPEPTGGVAHAPMSVSEMCWGARVVRVGMLSENPHEPERQISSRKEQQNCFASAAVPAGVAPNFPGVIASWFAVAPVPDCPGALGRVKGPLRRCAPLTRPARSRCSCNYRSDGTTRFDSWLAHHSFISKRRTAPSS